jgi:hypothetical protein
VIAAVTLALTLAAGPGMPPPSAEPLPEPSATAAPAASAPAVPEPSTAGETAAPAPSTTPSASVTATPDPYKYRFVPRQPAVHEPGTPQIFAIFLNDRTLHGSGVIAIKVVTSPDVVKVITRSNGRDGVIPEIAAGDFEASSRLPKIPFIAAGMTTLLEFVAFTADGKTASVKVPVRLE